MRFCLIKPFSYNLCTLQIQYRLKILFLDIYIFRQYPFFSFSFSNLLRLDKCLKNQRKLLTYKTYLFIFYLIITPSVTSPYPKPA